MSIPAAIFFVNADLNDLSKSTLTQQLDLTETMTGEEFDARMAWDPNYAQVVHLQKTRIMVIRSDFHDHTNRTVADVVMFVKQGLVSIEKNNFGPPGLTLPLERINLYALLRYNNSSEVTILPTTPTTRSSALGGIFTILSTDPSGVHDANTDNEANNEDFINRK
jgi:hypothetical protein